MACRHCILSLIPLTLMFFVGCSGNDKGPRTVPAKGVITLDGEPVEGAAVVFVGDQHSATGISDSSGNFSLDAFEYKTGAVPGSYMWIATKTVEVTSESVKLKGEEAEHAGEGTQIGIKNDLPNRYQSPKPDQKITIPEDGITDIKLELTSK